MSVTSQSSLVELPGEKCQSILTDEKRDWLLASVTSDENKIGRMLRANSELVNWQSYFDGNTALHYAAKFGNTQLIRILVGDYQADVNIRNYAGLTPLHFAAICSQGDAIILLTSTYGADTTLRDHSGRTPGLYLPKTENGSKLLRLFKSPLKAIMKGDWGEVMKPLDSRESKPDERGRSISPSVCGPPAANFPWQANRANSPQRDSLRSLPSYSGASLKRKYKSVRAVEPEREVLSPTSGIKSPLTSREQHRKRSIYEDINALIKEKHEQIMTKYSPLRQSVNELDNTVLPSESCSSPAQIRQLQSAVGDVTPTPCSPDLFATMLD